MQPPIDRRRFLKSALAATTACASATAFAPFVSAIPPIQRNGPPRLLLSLAAYSFRDYFDHNRGRPVPKTEGKKQINLRDFIDFCAEHGCAGTELTSYYFPEKPSPEFLLGLRHYAFLRGIEISGTAVGNTFTLPPGQKRDQEIASVKTWIDHSALMGAPHIRVFAGTASGMSKEEAKKLAIEALEDVCDYAATRGVMIGLENHGGIVAEADDLLDIVKAVQSPWFGVNLDTGNFHTADPYADIARCAPFSVNAQIKVDIRPAGKPQQRADIPRLIHILKETGYQGYVALEYEASEDPWKAIPALLAELKPLCTF